MFRQKLLVKFYFVIICLSKNILVEKMFILQIFHLQNVLVKKLFCLKFFCQNFLGEKSGWNFGRQKFFGHNFIWSKSFVGKYISVWKMCWSNFFSCRNFIVGNVWFKNIYSKCFCLKIPFCQNLKIFCP